MCSAPDFRRSRPFALERMRPCERRQNAVIKSRCARPSQKEVAQVGIEMRLPEILAHQHSYLVTIITRAQSIGSGGCLRSVRDRKGWKESFLVNYSPLNADSRVSYSLGMLI